MLTYNRVLSAVIVPFLVVGFVVLYVFPHDTDRLWAWTIASPMTSMTLASAYLGGAYFFVRVVTEPRWRAARTGFLAVALFASLLGIATIVHWDTFAHDHIAFWLWTGLYFTTPFLVIGGWWANQRVAAPAGHDDRRLSPVTRGLVGLVGLVSLAQGVVMFLTPSRMIDVWPWALTPLTCRVLAAIFCLGSAGVVVLFDPWWSSIRLMLQVEVLMIILILVGAARAHSEFDTGRPLTWVMLTGFLAVLLGSAYLWYVMEVHPRPGSRAGAA